MNWNFNLFQKKIFQKVKSGSLLRDGQYFFEKGKKFYFEKNLNRALCNFDLAIENGIEKEVYELRGRCLQELNYEYDAIEDFNKAIILSPSDCNIYLARSISKHSILDFEGEINDLEKAICLSKVENDLNKGYYAEAIKMGYNSVESLFHARLVGAQIDLESKINNNSEANFAKRLAGIRRR
jgi:tetratricopeptide (TPR) repeat protein